MGIVIEPGITLGGNIKVGFTGLPNNPISVTISSSQKELNLSTFVANLNVWDGYSAVTVTINSGVYIWSANTANAALDMGGKWPSGVTVINNGYIMGMGGQGGTYGSANGGNGGPAINLTDGIAIRNNSYIVGGGGGGASDNFAGGGGGAGGGYGGNTIESGANGGGQGGLIGGFGFNGLSNYAAGGGGGCVIPGTGGGYVSTNGVPGDYDFPGYGGGSGGSGGAATRNYISGTVQVWHYAGAGGGGWGQPGGNAGNDAIIGNVGSIQSGSGGTANSAGVSTTTGTSNPIYYGGAGGPAIKTNGYSIIWVATGTVWGSIS